MELRSERVFDHTLGSCLLVNSIANMDYFTLDAVIFYEWRVHLSGENKIRIY